jgi:Ca2+-binding EF-hand superfamily protein
MSTTEGIGSSTSSQLSPGMAKLGSTLTTYLQDKLLKKVDVDENGTAEQSEFRAALEQLTGKLGVEMTEDAEAMFTGLDADGSGGLDGQEMGQFLRNVFSAPTNTQDFLAGRGDDATATPTTTSGFDALDADGNGSLTRAEFEHTAAADQPYSTVTTTVTTVTSNDPALASTGAATAPSETTAGATPSATAGANTSTDALKAMLASADADRNGQVSSNEVDQFIAQLASQMQLALTQFSDISSAGAKPAAGASSATA